MIKVLSVASECAPLVKTGGLADVVGALPGALAHFGVQLKTLLPGYPQVLAVVPKAKVLAEVRGCFGGTARVLAGKAGGLDLLILDAPHLFDRPGNIYLGPDGKDWPDNAERFAALSWVAAKLADGLVKWRPDIVHCHDWQAGLAPYYMRKSGVAVRSVTTIHNIAFQGLAPADMLRKLKIGKVSFGPEGVEYWGQISSLKAAVTCSDKVTTVSPKYAQELLTPEFGMGFDGILGYRRDDLSGILNGIDEAVWNPATDTAIRPFKTPRGKAANKRDLRKAFDLPDADGPLCVVVSRLTEQKGLDLLLNALPALTGQGGQLGLLGSGDPALEAAFEAAAADANVGVRIGYDEALSHLMYAGGDAVLVPSRFEPCGLTQLYGLRYGAVPVVSLTGGLADTVINANLAALARGAATGIQFSPITSEALTGALLQLCDLYRDPATWDRLQKNAMSHPVGWDTSAARYAGLYKGLLSVG